MARHLLWAVGLLGLAGCQSQPTTVANPFLTPDRVPPPQTRVLAPGTAQPYYPGDPMPGAATYQPPAGTTPSYGAPAGSATTPPGGWNGYPQYQRQGAPAYQQPPAGTTPTYDYGVTPTSAALDPYASGGQFAVPGRTETVRVPEDGQQARLALGQATLAPPQIDQARASEFTTPSVPPADTVAAQPRLPIQKLLTDPRDFASAPAATSATLSATPVGPSSWDDSAFQKATFVDRTSTLTASPASFTSTDGFRPRGASSSDSGASNGAFQPPAITRAGVDAAAAPAGDLRYGAGVGYEWLRGQLVLDGITGMLFVQYMTTGADPYGGALPLANPEVVANLLPGEYVKLTGQVVNVPRDDDTLMPVFRVSGVERQVR